MCPCLQAVLWGDVPVQLADGDRQPEQQRQFGSRPFQSGKWLKEISLMWAAGCSRKPERLWCFVSDHFSISAGAESSKTSLSPKGVWLYNKTSHEQVLMGQHTYDYIKAERFSINEFKSVLWPSFLLYVMFMITWIINLRGSNSEEKEKTYFCYTRFQWVTG